MPAPSRPRSPSRLSGRAPTAGVVRVAWAMAFALAGNSAAQEPAGIAPPPVILDLNLPAFQLEVRSADSVLHRFAVAIGAPWYPTPVGEFEIAQVIWNPVWVPPPSPWAGKDTVTPPGPGTPMLKVKFQVKGLYYIHGTPSDSSIGHAASHGCIRMRATDAMTLARLLQHRTGAAITDAEVDSLAAQSLPTRTVSLPIAIPIRIRYDAAEVTGDTLTIYPDVYARNRGRMEAILTEVLASAGVDTLRVRADSLSAIAARAKRTPVRTPLERILLPPVPD